MRKLNLGQRVVMIIGWAVILWLVGRYVTSVGVRAYGWVAYAPLSGATVARRQTGLYLTSLEDFFMWLFLVVMWVVGSVLVLGIVPRHRIGGNGLDASLPGEMR